MAVHWCIIIALILPNQSRHLAVASNLTTSSIVSQPLPPSVEGSNGTTSNDSSNWVIIFLVVVLFVATIAVAIHLSLVSWQKYMKNQNTRHASEMQVLLGDQDIDTVEKRQQPRVATAEGRQTFSTTISVPVNQQLPTDSRSSSPEDLRCKGNIPKGLVNIGNTCYFNSVLQCLSQTYLLGEKLYAPSECGGELTVSFKEFLNLMQFEQRPSFVPNYLFSVFCKAVRRFASGEQQDGHGCLRCFLDELRKEERNRRSDSNIDKSSRPSRKKLTLVDRLFGGHFMNTYVCKTCNVPYHICEPFLDINLLVMTDERKRSATERPAGDQGEDHETEDQETLSSTYSEPADLIHLNVPDSTGEPIQTSYNRPTLCLSVEDCLQYFIRRDSIEDEYLCMNCNRLSNGSKYEYSSAIKETVIIDPPVILTIHLKRFEQKSQYRFVKLDDRISFTELLDLAPFCCCVGSDKNEANLWYALYAVIVHFGSVRSPGHHVAYIKVRERNRSLEQSLTQKKEYFDRDKDAVDQLVNVMNEAKKEKKTQSWTAKAQQGIWYRMNDSDVSRVSAEEVMDQNAYLLFYEKLNSTDM